MKQLSCDFQLDALLITDPYNIRYLSGFRGGEGALYISKNQNVLITDSRYTEQAEKESEFAVIEENSAHNRVQILKECIWKEKSGFNQGFSMGYEDNYMICSEFEQLREKLPVTKWAPLKHHINDFRRIKTEEEIALLAKAESIGDYAFSQILKVLKPGMTEIEVAATLEYHMKMAGAENLSFSTIVASGIHSSMPHAIPDEKKLEYGDFLTMDFGCKYKGYCSDMTRTVVIGKASEKQREIYQVVLNAQLSALDALCAGKTGKEIDRVARTIIERAGYGNYFGHGLGHSVGLYIHENPRLSPTDDTVLEEGMIETVEPGIYIPGFGGVRIEDMAVVTKNGCKNLASSPKELIEL